MWDELLWKQEKSSNLEGLADKVSYFYRSLGNQSYMAHVFIAQYNSSAQMQKCWKKLNDEIAFSYQSKVNSLLERSNFYICLFISEKMDGMEKAKIENDVYCAKKYVFEIETSSIEEKLQIIDKKIFKLECLEWEKHQETNLLSIEVENFRVYEGNKKLQFSMEQDPQNPASLVMIYAPNGVGKTSICDAIEWGLTGNVQRLKTMEKIIGKGGMLLHNRAKYKSTKEYIEHRQQAYVKLRWKEDNGSIAEFKRTVTRGENDLQRGRVTGNKTLINDNLLWNQVIMPHDRIEEFIGATKPVDRYKEWLNCIDPKGELQCNYEEKNIAYLKVKRQYKDIEEELKKLEEEQGTLKTVGAALKELEKNIKQYNEIAPEDLQIQVENDNITVEEFLSIQTKVGSYIANVQNKECEYKKKQNILNEYLANNGEEFRALEAELNQSRNECTRWDKILKDRLAYEKLQMEWNLVHKDSLKLEDEFEILQYILQQGEEEMEEKKRKLYLIKKQLPEQNKKLETILSQLAELEKLLAEYQKKIKRLEQIDRKEEKLIQIAKDWEKLTSKRNREIALLAKKERTEKAAKSSQQQKHEAYYKILEYTLPDTIEQYAERQIPQEDIMFHYAGRFENLLQQKSKVENSCQEYKKMLDEARIAEQQISQIVVDGRTFLENHPSQCECPLCHTQFTSWNALYNATLKLENSQKAQLEKIEEQLENEKTQLAKSYTNIQSEWTNERRIKMEKMSEACSQANNEVCVATAARQDAEKNVLEVQIQQNELCNQAIKLGWDQAKELTAENVEKVVRTWRDSRAEQLREVVFQKTTVETRKEKLQSEKEQYEQKISEFQKWNSVIENDIFYEKSVSYLYSMSSDFNATIKKIELEAAIKAQNEKNLQIKNEMLKYHAVSDIDVAFCKKEKERTESELKKIQKIYKGLSALVNTENLSLDTLEEMKRMLAVKQEYRGKLLEKLYEIQYSGGLVEGIEKYKNNEKELRKLEENRFEMKYAIIKAEREVNKEKNKLLEKMDAYFRQPLFNEIYQKIDPHPYMKNVEYQIQYNEEKNQPELYINTCTEDHDIYQPEWFFSTAQLNTVALSSFLSRALSLTELPIGTILIDDPVGHFDDMNILGFADLIRSILENSEKQIIITTHDETVYQIFRRKIPPEKYKSRFIDMTME